MSYCDIFNFDKTKITFSEPIATTNENYNYQKVYLNYDNEKFHFELPPIEMVISKNTRKQYDAYSSKFKLGSCIKKQDVIHIFNQIYETCVDYIESNKNKLNFKNKKSFSKSNCGNFANPLYYVFDKDTGEINQNYDPMIYSSIILTGKDATNLKYPKAVGKTENLEIMSYIGVRIYLIPIIQVSNLYISNDGDIRLQLLLKTGLVYNILNNIPLEQPVDFNKYNITVEFKEYKD